jgi:hypothetical protein
MKRKKFKRFELTIRQIAVSINRFYDSSPFSQQEPNHPSSLRWKETIGVLKCSLTAPSRARFDFNGYILTLHFKTRFIEVCEIIERNELVLETTNPNEDISHIKKTKKLLALKAAVSLAKSKSRITIKNIIILSMGTNRLIVQQTSGL